MFDIEPTKTNMIEDLVQSCKKQASELEPKRIAREAKVLSISQGAGQCSNGICQLYWKPSKKNPAA